VCFEEADLKELTMTRMTKDETKLLAQAAVIVDSLMLPWKKLSDNFEKKTIGAVEPERTLLDAASGTPSFITDLPQNLVSAELFKQIEKAKKVIDDIHTTQVSVWYNELMYASTPIKNIKYQDWFTTGYKAYYSGVAPLFWDKNGDDSILQEFKRAQNSLPTNVDQAHCRYIFQKAFTVIRNKERWTQGAYSRTVEIPKTYTFYEAPSCMPIEPHTEIKVQRQIYTDVEKVQKFCSAGAILNADGALGGDDESHKKLSPEAIFVGGQLSKFMHGDIATFNDTSIHEGVVQAWERCGQANGWL
jgi:hypothetical protein